MSTLHHDKAALRDAQRTSRKARTVADQHSASLKIAALLTDLLPKLAATKVAGYSAIRGEVSLDPAFQAVGHLEWYLPKVIERGDALAFGRWHKGGLETGAYGILEPQGPYVSLQALDIALIPGLAFTRHGHRLGMGGGFYDRSLIGYGGIAIGVAYDEEVVEEIPMGQHDCLVDYLVTPSGWHKCQA